MIVHICTLPFFAFVALVESAAGSQEISHVAINDARLIYTSSGNYAMTGPSIKGNKWQSVSVNEENVVIFKTNCETVMTGLKDLTEAERALLKKEKEILDSVDNKNDPQKRVGPAKYIISGEVLHLNTLQPKTMSIYTLNGYSIFQTSKETYSVSGPNLPNDLVRIFVEGDLVAGVYNDNQVQMKPLVCLESSEKSKLDDIKRNIRYTDTTQANKLKGWITKLETNISSFTSSVRDKLRQGSELIKGLFRDKESE